MRYGVLRRLIRTRRTGRTAWVVMKLGSLIEDGSPVVDIHDTIENSS
jgi:hypothetical protein